MSSVTPLLDTLLATKLAQRVDLVPLKGQTDIGNPTFANPVEQVANDVRLSSRELLQQQLGVAPASSSGGRASSGAQSRIGGETVTLSAVARALTAILDPPPAVAPRILGTEALWSDSQALDAQQLTTTLARTVDNSGLFYESHLQHYAAGTRTLAQMAQEPQGQLYRASGQSPVLPSAAQSALVALTSDSSPAAALPTRPDAAAHQTSITTAIHPATLALVRHQLDLLVQPQFRWSGEAWSGTTMDWDIEQEQESSQGASEDEAAQQRWTTRLAMSLPTLGTVEARLSLVGNTLQLRMAASQQATVSLLGEAGTDLPQRLGVQGLQLTGLQIAALAAASSVSP